MAATRPARPSATLVVVRDGPAGLEVLLLCRAERGDHNSGAWVFPGGLVEAADRQWHGCCDGLTDAQASARLGLPEGGLDYCIAALRECFEECGLLFASGPPQGEVAPWRGLLHRGEKTLGEFCRTHRVQLDAGALAYLSHWLTPLGRAKRYDTRFFVAQAPQGQEARHDGTEMIGLQWMRPADALAQGAALKLMGPTRATLMTLERFDTAAAALAWARSPREVSLIHPRIGVDRQGPRPVLPTEPAYAELGKLDPEGRGDAHCDIEPGRAVRLSPGVVRVTAPNASVMTGPGTNTYLVGLAGQPCAVIDPGPADESHVRAVLAAAPGPIRWIVATHTHHDHSPAAALLKAHTRAEVLGRLPGHPHKQDGSFAPDRILVDGDRLAVAPSLTLRVLHTPGHASNHLCLLLEEERMLFTGDHVMQTTTVVINPPDGDMAAYLASLRTLHDELAPGLDWLAPAHGFLMAQPQRALQALIKHRLQREAKVLRVLRAHGPGTLEQLLPLVYDDVDPRMLPVAARSLLAHLNKLRHDAAVVADPLGAWSAA